MLQGVLIGALLAAGIWSGGTWDGQGATLGVAVGLLLVVLGGGLALRGLRDLGGALTPLPRPRDGATLVEHGVYGRVRHPIYGGLVIAAAGWALLSASTLALAMTGVLFVFFDLKARREERWLEERYPGYPAYRARTRRLLPALY